MQVFIFKSEADNTVLGFTAQKDGGNLPAEYAPWKPQGNTALQSGTNPSGTSVGADEVTEAVRQDGFYLVRPRITTSRSSTH